MAVAAVVAGGPAGERCAAAAGRRRSRARQRQDQSRGDKLVNPATRQARRHSAATLMNIAIRAIMPKK